MTTIADTLACDKVLISALQQNHDYDYDRELAAQQPSLWDWLVAQFNEWLDRLLGNSVSVGLRNAILVFIGISVVGLIVWFLYKYRPELFRRSRTEGDADADDGEDTIYGIDFDAEISRARVAGDYRQAVRYLYLKTLRRLSDTGRIDWQPSKTPSQYVREMPTDEFRLLTRHFLRVRYGNFEASAALFDEMAALVEKGGLA